jgi:hypothetical protein
MADFPSRASATSRIEIKPTNRSFSFGEYPIKSYRSISGAVLKRAFGNRAFNYSLQLEFANVSDAIVSVIFDHYHGQGGPLNGFRIPSTVLSGMDSDLAGRIQRPEGILWFYEAAPEVQSVPPDLSTISFSLIGELAYQ